MLSSLFHFYQVRYFQFSPKIVRWKQNMTSDVQYKTRALGSNQQCLDHRQSYLSLSTRLPSQDYWLYCFLVYWMKTLSTVIFLSFRTDRSGQTVQTQIRLLLSRSSLIRVYTVCHSVCIVWTHYSMVEPHRSNFRSITTNILGVEY